MYFTPVPALPNAATGFSDAGVNVKQNAQCEEIYSLWLRGDRFPLWKMSQFRSLAKACYELGMISANTPAD